MVVAQAVCFVAYAIDIFCAYYQSQCNDSIMSNKERKRKVRTWEREFESIKKPVNDVTEATKEGNCVIERSQQRIVKIGVERNLRYTMPIVF